MRLVNLTPHNITVRTGRGDITIPPSGQIARVQTVQREAGHVNVAPGVRVPVVETTFGEVVGLSEPRPGVTYIVSSLVLQAVSGRDDLVAPDTGSTAVRENGRIIAVTRFQK